MKALKTIAWSIFGLLAVACLFLLVPEYPDSPERSVEKLVSINVSPRGDRLLVRSVEHDYEFALPPNRLNDAFAVPPKDEAMVGLRADLTEAQSPWKVCASSRAGGSSQRQCGIWWL